MYIDKEKFNEYYRKKYKENPEPFKKKWKKSYEKNKEKRLVYYKKYRENNKEYIKIKQTEYTQKNKEKIKARKAQYRKERGNALEKERTKTDINFRLKKNLRRRVLHALHGTVKKTKHTIELIGCSISELKLHLETLFTEGMSWDNYGQWHIDHYYPCSFFILTDYQEQKFCFHYTNLRPLWAKDNMSKNDKLPPEIINN
jgi:hypothetical protein